MSTPEIDFSSVKGTKGTLTIRLRSHSEYRDGSNVLRCPSEKELLAARKIARVLEMTHEDLSTSGVIIYRKVGIGGWSALQEDPQDIEL